MGPGVPCAHRGSGRGGRVLRACRCVHTITACVARVLGMVQVELHEQGYHFQGIGVVSQDGGRALQQHIHVPCGIQVHAGEERDVRSRAVP